MKYLIAFFIALTVGFSAMLLLAAIFGVWNISLIGRGVTWPSETFHWHFIQMSIFDVVLLLFGLLVFVLTFTLVLFLKNKTPDW